jgi:hypothetical protein
MGVNNFDEKGNIDQLHTHRITVIPDVSGTKRFTDSDETASYSLRVSTGSVENLRYLIWCATNGALLISRFSLSSSAQNLPQQKAAKVFV